MRITVLGSAAGGGFPQWNCNCRNCAGRARRNAERPRRGLNRRSSFSPTTPSTACSSTPRPTSWSRSAASRHCSPARALRDSAIAGVVLMDGQIDHATGLFMLRERSTPLPLWCTDPVDEDLSQGNPVLRVLAHYCGVRAPSHRARRQLVRGARRRRPEVARAAAVEQGGALFAAPRTTACRATTSAC